MHAQLCPTLFNLMDYCSLPGTSVHGIFQARILGWAKASQISKEVAQWQSLAGCSFTGLFFLQWQRLHFPSSLAARYGHVTILSQWKWVRALLCFHVRLGPCDPPSPWQPSRQNHKGEELGSLHCFLDDRCPPITNTHFALVDKKM